jgi:hypothetical protein
MPIKSSADVLNSSTDNNWHLNLRCSLMKKFNYDMVAHFSEGFALACRYGSDDYCNYIDSQGTKLSKNAFKMVTTFLDIPWYFNEGFAIIEDKHNKLFFINRNGELLNKEGFDETEGFSEGFAKVKLNKKWFFIDTTGKTVILINFDEAYDFSEGFAGVKVKGKWFFTDKKGKLLLHKGAGWLSGFSNGFARITFDNKLYYINKRGQIINKTGFEFGSNFYQGTAIVTLGEKTFEIMANGEKFCLKSKKASNQVSEKP